MAFTFVCVYFYCHYDVLFSTNENYPVAYFHFMHNSLHFRYVLENGGTFCFGKNGVKLLVKSYFLVVLW